jgi:hypothetical protein
VEHQTVHYARLAKEIHSDAVAGVHYIHADDLKHVRDSTRLYLIGLDSLI